MRRHEANQKYLLTENFTDIDPPEILCGFELKGVHRIMVTWRYFLKRSSTGYESNRLRRQQAQVNLCCRRRSDHGRHLPSLAGAKADMIIHSHRQNMKCNSSDFRIGRLLLLSSDATDCIFEKIGSYAHRTFAIIPPTVSEDVWDGWGNYR